jgi:hypothetical protein
MGRKKVETVFVKDHKARNSMYYKRAKGIEKKAAQLAVQTGAQVLLVIRRPETGTIESFTSVADQLDFASDYFKQINRPYTKNYTPEDYFRTTTNPKTGLLEYAPDSLANLNKISMKTQDKLDFNDPFYQDRVKTYADIIPIPDQAGVQPRIQFVPTSTTNSRTQYSNPAAGTYGFTAEQAQVGNIYLGEQPQYATDPSNGIQDQGSALLGNYQTQQNFEGHMNSNDGTARANYESNVRLDSEATTLEQHHQKQYEINKDTVTTTTKTNKSLIHRRKHRKHIPKAPTQQQQEIVQYNPDYAPPEQQPAQTQLVDTGGQQSSMATSVSMTTTRKRKENGADLLDGLFVNVNISIQNGLAQAPDNSEIAFNSDDLFEQTLKSAYKQIKSTLATQLPVHQSAMTLPPPTPLAIRDMEQPMPGYDDFMALLGNNMDQSTIEDLLRCLQE